MKKPHFSSLTIFFMELGSEKGAQIDLVIDRNDRIINGNYILLAPCQGPSSAAVFFTVRLTFIYGNYIPLDPTDVGY